MEIVSSLLDTQIGTLEESPELEYKTESCQYGISA